MLRELRADNRDVLRRFSGRLTCFHLDCRHVRRLEGGNGRAVRFLREPDEPFLGEVRFDGAGASAPEFPDVRPVERERAERFIVRVSEDRVFKRPLELVGDTVERFRYPPLSRNGTRFELNGYAEVVFDPWLYFAPHAERAFGPRELRVVVEVEHCVCLTCAA